MVFNIVIFLLVRSGEAGIEFLAVRKLFNELAEGHCGSIERAKAQVQMGQGPYRLVIVRGYADCVSFAKCVEDSRLVIIGEGLDEQVIRWFLESKQVRPAHPG